ncbi:MAG: hypothetical protein ACTSXG_02265 [Alphaproteobacteria bacterium]
MTRANETESPKGLFDGTSHTYKSYQDSLQKQVDDIYKEAENKVKLLLDKFQKVQKAYSQLNMIKDMVKQMSASYQKN